VPRDGFLVLSALGPDRPGLVAEVTEFLVDLGCNVDGSRMAVLGGEFGMMMLVRGAEDQLQAIQRGVGELERRTGLRFSFRPTVDPRERQRPPAVPYVVSAYALDHEGIVHAVSEALYRLGANIVSLETDPYSAPHTATTLFRMEALVEVPPQVSVAELRASLSRVAAQQNLDLEVRPA